jgi:carboxylate-amine ligase
VLDELGSREAVEHLHEVLEEGTSADRQLKGFAEHGDLSRVVDDLCEETVAAP